MTLRLVLLSLLLSAPALAQQVVIAGTVLDATTKQGLGEARVTASSPSLQGEQVVVVTDASGQYRMPQLPPGTYALRFEKASFQPYNRASILMHAGRTIRINAFLLPSGVVEANPVHVHLGPIAPAQAHVRQVLAVRPTPRTLPVRPFVSLVELAPRSHRALYAYSSGSAAPDIAFVIDGVSRMEPEWFHHYTPILRPTGTEQWLQVYPEQLP